MELFANLDIHFSGVAPLFQNYFYNENAQESYLAFLHRGASTDIRNLPVYVRWDDVGHSMGRGKYVFILPNLYPKSIYNPTVRPCMRIEHMWAVTLMCA